MEIWKDIPGYEGMYQASTCGRVRSVDGKVTYSVRCGKRTWKGRVLKPKACANYSKTGYRVTLWKDKQPFDYLVARLVATTFHENLINTDMTVNHKDGNRLNNNADNLEWLSLADNIRHGFNTGLYGTSKPVELTDVRSGFKKAYRSLTSCAKDIGRCVDYVRLRVYLNKPVVSANGETYLSSVITSPTNC